MENIFSIQNIIGIITLLVYCIIYFIQKAQFNKQNEILNKYEKIFSIINVDEIEKYVELQKKSISLSYSNREIELTQGENLIELKFGEIKDILDGSKTNLEKSKEILENVKHSSTQSINLLKEFNKLGAEEFKEIYSILEIIKTKNPDLFKEIDNKILMNFEKYNLLKNQIIEKI